MEVDEIIEKTKEFVQTTLQNAESGHDWFHTLRVYKNALLIAQGENADKAVVALAALLHDIADYKFNDGDETKALTISHDFLKSMGVDNSTLEEVLFVIKNVSFSSSLEKNIGFKPSVELQIVQDADRLDALGAIGIARCFNYGGYKNRPIYNPEILPNLQMNKETYKNSDAPSINHFYEKLLLLKDKMHTKTARRIAEKRHAFLETFLKQFYLEWEGKG
ncbi:MAG: phosphohydrolase [Flavobacteriales bacterium]|nr:MAG: phosphohydrolase [Flavobacteriales bacterium]